LLYYFNSNRLDQLHCSIENFKLANTNEAKETIKIYIDKCKTDIKNLGKDFEKEKDNLLFFNKYNSQVMNIRNTFSVSNHF
jgi:hypothetical protein